MDFHLPIKIDKDCEYQGVLNNVLAEYLITIKDKVHENDYVKIEAIINKINHTVVSFYDSKIAEAYSLVKEIVTEIRDTINDVVCGVNSLYDYISNQNEPFYKARVGDTNESYSENDMLHIPFNMRGKVSNQRFSVSGCPCIYLGKTSFVTWLELDKPLYSHFYESGAYISDDIKVFNLAYTSWQILNKKIIEQTLDTIEKKTYTKEALVFPLIIATSFKINEKGRTFKSEYIISQLITQAVVDIKIDGIAYLSKRMDDYDVTYPLNLCLAILAKNGKNDYTSDQNKIKINKPINYSEFLALPIDSIGGVVKGSDSTSVSILNSIAETNLEYGGTSFWKFDKFIQRVCYTQFKEDASPDTIAEVEAFLNANDQEMVSYDIYMKAMDLYIKLSKEMQDSVKGFDDRLSEMSSELYFNAYNQNSIYNYNAELSKFTILLNSDLRVLLDALHSKKYK